MARFDWSVSWKELERTIPNSNLVTVQFLTVTLLRPPRSMPTLPGP